MRIDMSDEEPLKPEKEIETGRLVVGASATSASAPVLRPQFD
jgi:hypothetical protein